MRQAVAAGAATIPADEAGIAAAVAALRAGALVALPTETVYGLAARADDAAAVARIYAAKRRPAINPLIVHVQSADHGAQFGAFDAAARAIAARFWPGPVTLVVPRRAEAGLAPAVTAGLATVALRCPAHPVIRAVLARSGVPLAAPSANASGEISATTAAHVVASLGAAAGLVLDGGPCPSGIESTIVAVRPGGAWQVLRPGPITTEAIATVLGADTHRTTAAGRIEAPGQLARHYAPGKPLRLGALAAEVDEFMIGFGAVAGEITLSASGDLAEAARALYAALHRAAQAPQPRIALAPIPDEGIGAAINDRLRRAAA